MKFIKLQIKNNKETILFLIKKLLFGSCVILMTGIVIYIVLFILIFFI